MKFSDTFRSGIGSGILAVASAVELWSSATLPPTASAAERRPRALSSRGPPAPAAPQNFSNENIHSLRVPPPPREAIVDQNVGSPDMLRESKSKARSEYLREFQAWHDRWGSIVEAQERARVAERQREVAAGKRPPDPPVRPERSHFRGSLDDINRQYAHALREYGRKYDAWERSLLDSPKWRGMVVIRTDYFHVSPDGKQRIPLDQSFVREAQALSPGSELNIFGRYRFEEFRDREKKGWKVESRSVYGDGSSR